MPASKAVLEGLAALERAGCLRRADGPGLPEVPKPSFPASSDASGTRFQASDPILSTDNGDPFRSAVRAALNRLLEYQYPPSALLWASVWMPAGYDNVVEHYPDRIHELWTGGAPMRQFQIVLDNYMAAHKRICVAFTKYKAENPAPDTKVAMVTSYTVDTDRGGCVCNNCGVWYATISGWQAHNARVKC